MRLCAGRRGDDVAAANRDGRVAKPICAFARHDEEQLVHDVMPMEGERLLAGRYDVHRATQAIEPDQRADAAPFDRELLAIATIHERHVIDIDDSFFSHLPDSFQTNRNPFCASPANVDQVGTLSAVMSTDERIATRQKTNSSAPSVA
jgi:hypothetical protein